MNTLFLTLCVIFLQYMYESLWWKRYQLKLQTQDHLQHCLGWYFCWWWLMGQVSSQLAWCAMVHSAYTYSCVVSLYLLTGQLSIIPSLSELRTNSGTNVEIQCVLIGGNFMPGDSFIWSACTAQQWWWSCNYHCQYLRHCKYADHQHGWSSRWRHIYLLLELSWLGWSTLCFFSCLLFYSAILHILTYYSHTTTRLFSWIYRGYLKKWVNA